MKNSNRLLYSTSVLLVLMLFAIGNTTQSTLLDQYVKHYSLNAARQSYISSVISIGMFTALCLLLFGFIRIRRQITLVVTAFIITFFFLTLSFMPSFYLLLLFYFFIGISYGLIDSVASSTTADLYAGKNASRHMGLLHSFFGIGGVCGPLFIQILLINNISWNGILLIFSLISFIIFLYSLTAYIKTKEALKTIIGITPKISIYGLRNFSTKQNVLFMLAVGIKGAQEVCLAFWLVQYISIGLNNSLLGPLAISLLWLGSSLSRIIIPILSIDINNYLIFSMLGSALILSVSLIFPSALFMCIACLMVGLTSGAVIPMGLSVLCKRCPDNTLMASTVTLLCIYAGQALFPFAAGLLFSGLLSAGIIMAVICGILSSVLSFVSTKV